MLFWCYFTAARRNRIGRSRVRRKLVFAFRADRDLADGKALAELEQPAFGIERARGPGFFRKLMLRFVVTASGTHPIEASTATYIVASARVIRVVPEIVPPGRSDFGRKAYRSRAMPCAIPTMERLLPGWKASGNSAASRPRSSSSAMAGSGTEAPFPPPPRLPARLDFRRPEATFRIQWYRVLGKTSGSSDERAGSGTAQCSRAAAREPRRHRAP